jgi:hypothetical protein
MAIQCSIRRDSSAESWDSTSESHRGPHSLLERIKGPSHFQNLVRRDFQVASRCEELIAKPDRKFFFVLCSHAIEHAKLRLDWISAE